MKKRNQNILALDEPAESLDDMALLMFLTQEPNYAFVDELNHLYDLQLSRLDDLEAEGCCWPLFSYNNPMLQLRYFLIEKPASAAAMASNWSTGHKLLILKGQCADEVATTLYDDFTQPPLMPDPSDLSATARYQRLASLYQNFIPVSRISLDDSIPRSKKNAKEYAALCSLIYSLIDQLDIGMLG